VCATNPWGKGTTGAETAAGTLKALCGLVLELLETTTDLGGSESSMTSERADSGDLAGTSPPGDRLGVYPKQCGDFGRGEESIWGRGLGHLKSSFSVRPLSDITV